MAPAARFQTVVSLFVGAVLLIGGSGALYSAIPGAQLVAAYEGAPPCASVTQALAGAACRYSGKATILDGFAPDGGVPFQLDGVAYRTFAARFGSSDYPYVLPHEVVEVEFWSGRVTRFNDGPTADNPEQVGNSGNLLILGGICSVLGIGLIVWTVRRRGDYPDGAVPDPGMAPVAVAGTMYNT